MRRYFHGCSSARDAAIKKVLKTKIITDLNEIPDTSLDAITLWHVFEHIDNQDVNFNYAGIFNFFFKEKEGQSVNNQETKI